MSENITESDGVRPTGGIEYEIPDTGLDCTEKLIYGEWCTNCDNIMENRMGDSHYAIIDPMNIDVNGRVCGPRHHSIGKQSCPCCGANINRATDPEGHVYDVLHTKVDWVDTSIDDPDNNGVGSDD